MHNESEQAKSWSQIYSEDTKKQSIPVIASWQLNERMYSFLHLCFYCSSSNMLSSLYTILDMMYERLFSIGMENYKVSISRKLQIDMERSRSMSGAVVMIYLHPMARVWKCVLKELLLISGNM